MISPVRLHEPLPPLPENTFSVEFRGRGAMACTAQTAKRALIEQCGYPEDMFSYCWYLGDRGTTHFITFHKGAKPNCNGKTIDISHEVVAEIRSANQQRTTFKILGLNPLCTPDQIKKLFAKFCNIEKLEVEEIKPNSAHERTVRYDGPGEDIPHWINVTAPGGYKEVHKIVIQGRMTICHHCCAGTHWPTSCPNLRERRGRRIEREREIEDFRKPRRVIC